MGITLDHVTCSYKGKYQTVRAVDDVSYAFEPGKCYAIIGKSGSGKTTLLSLMVGIDLPAAARSSWTASPPTTGIGTRCAAMW